VPLYAFDCAGCGPFELVRPMAEAGAPSTCPACGAPARRVYTPPGVPRLARPVRRALDLEEKSAHEPGVTATKRGRPLHHRHAPTPPWVLSH
jgi:putative FmdB family regulatory protein